MLCARIAPSTSRSTAVSSRSLTSTGSSALSSLDKPGARRCAACLPTTSWPESTCRRSHQPHRHRRRTRQRSDFGLRHHRYCEIIPKPECCDFHNHDERNGHRKRDHNPGADALGCRGLFVRADVSTDTHDQGGEEEDEERGEKQQRERQFPTTIQADPPLLSSVGKMNESEILSTNLHVSDQTDNC